MKRNNNDMYALSFLFGCHDVGYSPNLDQFFLHLARRERFWKGIGATREKYPFVSESSLFLHHLHHNLQGYGFSMKVAKRILRIETLKAKNRTTQERLVVFAWLKKVSMYPLLFTRVFDQRADIMRYVFIVDAVLTKDGRTITGAHYFINRVLRSRDQHIKEIKVLTIREAADRLLQGYNQYAPAYLGLMEGIQQLITNRFKNVKVVQKDLLRQLQDYRYLIEQI